MSPYASPCTCDYQAQVCAGCQHRAWAHTIVAAGQTGCPIHGWFGHCIRLGCGCQEMTA